MPHSHILSWQSQQPQILYLHSPCHQDMKTFLLSTPHHITFPSAPQPFQHFTFPLHTSHFPQKNIILSTSAHKPWIHLPRCTHKIELAFAIKLSSTHGPSLFSDKPSFVMPPNYYHIGLPKVNFHTFAAKNYISFHELIPESLSCLIY